MLVRDASTSDAPSCADIYRPFVLESAVTFETEPPTATEFAERITQRAATHAWLVAEEDGEVVGYAYAGPFAARAAYSWACETTVYVHRDRRGAGIGRLLYGELLPRLRTRGYQVAVARIALPNAASLRLHESFGFAQVGVLRRIGYKNGAWHDVHLCQVELARPTADPALPK
jgi:L-amino acid N-acyltransferase YncA